MSKKMFMPLYDLNEGEIFHSNDCATMKKMGTVVFQNQNERYITFRIVSIEEIEGPCTELEIVALQLAKAKSYWQLIGSFVDKSGVTIRSTIYCFSHIRKGFVKKIEIA